MMDTAGRMKQRVAMDGPAAQMSALSAWSAVIAVMLGAISLLAGWSYSCAALLSDFATSLKPTTAMCLVLAGYSLWAQRTSKSRDSRSAARICAAVVVLIGFAALMDQMAGSSESADALVSMGVATAARPAVSGAMGTLTATSLVLLGVTLLTLDARVGDWFPAQLSALAVALIALLAALGYLYGAPALYAVRGSVAMPPLAALALLALGCGALLARPRSGVMRPLSEDIDSAFVARRMVPLVLLLPIGLGWLRLLGQRNGLYATEFGLALHALSNVVCMGSLTWWAAARLGRSEQERIGARNEQAEHAKKLAAIEERERQATVRKAAVVDAALDCIVGMDREGRIIEFNAAAEKAFGRVRDEVMGHPLAEMIIPPRYREAHQAGLRRVLATGEKRILGRRVELAAMRADGSEFPVELTVIRMPGDEPPTFEGFIRDLTEQKEAEVALRASEASKNAAHAQLVVSDRMASVGTLAAGVAHEINNPLAAVVANLEFASEKAKEIVGARESSAQDRELADALQDATEAADRVRQIVLDLRIFARAEEDRSESVDVHSTLDSTLRMARNEIRHRARLVKAYGSNVPNVLGNASRLGQVFLNLIVNAAQAIPEGRADANEIRVSTSVDPAGQVVIEIQDTGEGIPPEVLSRLFTPFFTTKPAGVGTGLGLAICKRIVMNLGGEISVKSQPGVGTSFRVVLPATRRAVGLDGDAKLAVQARRRGAILVVDDDPMIGLAVRRTLSGEHEVRVTTNAREALASLNDGGHYDVILCDMMMPVVSGMDFYRQLRETAPDQADRVVFLTGGAFTIAAREFLDQVPNAHMEKPFQVQNLRAFINGRIQ